MRRTHACDPRRPGLTRRRSLLWRFSRRPPASSRRSPRTPPTPAPPAHRRPTAAAASTAVQGASCTAITANISLCQYISSCPSLALNAQIFPQCGFRIHGDAIDPECLCDGHYLCPIGHSTTCSAAAAAASGDTTYDSVCEQSVTGTASTSPAGARAVATLDQRLPDVREQLRQRPDLHRRLRLLSAPSSKKAAKPAQKTAATRSRRGRSSRSRPAP